MGTLILILKNPNRNFVLKFWKPEIKLPANWNENGREVDVARRSRQKRRERDAQNHEYVMKFRSPFAVRRTGRIVSLNSSLNKSYSVTII